jgi:hypothetical protein
MRTVHLEKTVRRTCVMTQRLNIAVLLVPKIMTGNVELQRAAKRDIEHLKALADRQNRKSA